MVMCLFVTSAYGQDPLPKEAPTSVRSVRYRQHKQRQHDIRETDSLCVIAMKRKYMHKTWYSRPSVTLYERFEPIEVVDIKVHRNSPTEVYFPIALRYKGTNKRDSIDAVFYDDGHCSFDDAFYTTPPRKEYPTVTHWQAVKNYDLVLGMNKQEAMLVWGSPDDVYTTRSRWGVLEQWVYYSNFGGHTRFLYFRNGRLSTIQR